MSENEALKMALESWANDLEQGRQVWIPATTLRKAASALAQPEQKPLAKVEPCAVCGEGKARLSVMRSCDTCHSEYAGQAEMKVALAQPLQRPWVGLTDAEMFEMSEFRNAHGYVPTSAKRLFARIEAKLKEKNT